MKICLFDIDGTLIQTGGAGKGAFEYALDSEFGKNGGASGVPFSGRTDRAIVRDLFVLYEIEQTSEAWERFQRAYLAYLPATLAANDGTVLPGILTLLEMFGARNDIAMGLLTGNTAEGAEAKLLYYQLNHFFEFGGYGNDHFDREGVAREALAAARRCTGEDVKPDDVWVIGDTPLDIRCARAIGANAIAVCTGHHSDEELGTEQPDLLLQDLTDPAPVLAAVGLGPAAE